MKGASTYSTACNIVNIIPSKTVKTRPKIASFLCPLIILWWAQVTVAPELKRITVFKRGTEKGLSGSIPKGGHTTPISIEGDKLLWKKAQKKEKKNRISDIINNKKPIFNPFTVILVWNPWKVDSLTTSLTHIIKQEITVNNPKNNKISWL